MCMYKRSAYMFCPYLAKYSMYTDMYFSIRFYTFLTHIDFVWHTYMLTRVRHEAVQAYRETRVALSARIVPNAKPMFRYGHGRYYRAYN